MSRTLFASDPQYRERAALWRVFSLLPLFGGLADERIWRWFAFNIPMDLGTGGTFTSDIDIIACLYDYPRSQARLYRTWEVKVSLLCRDGSARSLKAGKTARLVTQLTAYRRFGAPDVSFLDVYLCEAGFTGCNEFPPPSAMESIARKIGALRDAQFGYQLLPFEHGSDSLGDIGLRAPVVGDSPFKVLPVIRSRPLGGFSQLIQQIDRFFDHATDSVGYAARHVVFCKCCRSLQLIDVKKQNECPACCDDLIRQS